MNEWSRRRKRTILLLILFVLVVLVGLPVFLLFYHAPTCSDGKQNGDEAGVDCGGSCQKLCVAESVPLIRKGDPRVINVRGNLFEVVALVENPNINAEVLRAKYAFKIYDASNSVPVKVIENEIYVPKGATFAIFEGPFELASGIVPQRATLEWVQDSLLWQKNPSEAVQFSIRDLAYSMQETTPRLRANIRNASLVDASNIHLVALVSDETGNIFAASKTFIDSLASNSEVPVVFSWPRPFDRTIFNTNIIIRVLPDRSLR